MATIEEIITYAQNGQIESWIDTFLRAEGNNVLLADGLKKYPRYWLGPVQILLEKMTRCCGPEEGIEYRESSAVWSSRVEALVQHIRSDGQLPPFIVAYDKGILSVRDGNHRYGAYEKKGQKKH